MSEEKKSSVFKSRNFRLVFLGALVSEIGHVLYSFAVGFYILKISDNNALLQGIYLAVCGAAVLLATPVGGVLGDRFNKAKIMVLCDYLRGALILAATGLMLVFSSNGAHIGILFGTGVLGSVIGGIFSPAAGAIFPHIVEEDKLQQANAFFSVKSSLLGLVGIVLAGILYAALPIELLFFAVGLCYIGSGISEMFIRYEHRPKEGRLTVRTALTDMSEGLKYLKTQKGLVAFMVSILFINFFFAPVGSNFIPYFISTDVAGAPSYLFDKVLAPEMWSSVFEVATGISSLIGAVILSARPQKEKVGLPTAIRLCETAGLMLLLTGAYWLLVERGVSLNAFLIVLCAGGFLIGLLVVNINVPVSTALMRLVEPDKLSKVTSLTSVASQGLIPVASVLAGAVLKYAGSTVLLFVSALGFAATALFMLLNKRAREI